MKKDKEWLKEELSKQIDILHTTISSGNYVSLVKHAEIMNLIDQLEEPEQEKVVVPQFVADWIETMKQQNFTLGEVAEHLYSGDIKWSLLREYERWARLNFTKFTRAWLDGYTVEKESQWVVKTGKNWFFKNFESVGEYNYQAIGTGSIEEAKKFKDKLEAESVALLSDGEVEEVTK